MAKATTKKAAKKAAKTTTAKKVSRSSDDRATVTRPAPEVVVRVLEGDLKAGKQLSQPTPLEVEAWFATARHNLHRFIGEEAPQTLSFERLIKEALASAGDFKPGSATAGNTRKALTSAVEHACSVLQNYLRALRDEAGIADNSFPRY